MTLTCFRLFTQVHLLIDGSAEGQYATLLHLSKVLIQLFLSSYG